MGAGGRAGSDRREGRDVTTVNAFNRDDRPTGLSRVLEVLFIFISAPIIGALFGSCVPELLQEERDGGAVGLVYAIPGFVIGGIVGVAIIVRRARRRPPTAGD